MKKQIMAMGLAVSILMPTLVWAQGPGGGGQGGRGQRSMKMRLGGLMRGIGEIEKAKKAPLTKDQAKKIITFVNPWRAKPKMTEDEAKSLYIRVNGVLTTKQKNELDKMTALRRRQRDGGGPGGGGQGGGPGGGGPGGGAPDMAAMRQRMQKMRGFFRTYNPLYPPSKYKELKDMPDRMREGQTRRYQATVALLGQLSKKANGR